MTFVKKPYSNHVVTLKEVKKLINNTFPNHNMDYFIYEAVNVGDSKHHGTIHFHCIIFSNSKDAIGASSFKKFNKSSKTTINIKSIYYLPGVIGYIQDQHKVISTYTNNKLFKSKSKSINIQERVNYAFNIVISILKIIRSRRYVPT